MAKWLEGVIEPELVPYVSWIIIALLALVLLYVTYRILRAMTSSAFIARGRNRKARLAVMDAATVDDKRRLILVRRDDVEHLILIGGANDLVVERDIRMVARAQRPQPGEPDVPIGDEPAIEPRAPAFTPAPPARPATRSPVQPRPIERYAPSVAPRQPVPSAPRTPPAPEQPPVRPAAPPQQARSPEVQGQPRPPQLVASPQPRPATPPVAPAVAHVAARPAATARADDLDDALLSELQDSLDLPAPASPRAEPTLEDEMAKLLGELSRHRK